LARRASAGWRAKSVSARPSVASSLTRKRPRAYPDVGALQFGERRPRATRWTIIVLAMDMNEARDKRNALLNRMEMLGMVRYDPDLETDVVFAPWNVVLDAAEAVYRDLLNPDGTWKR